MTSMPELSLDEARQWSRQMATQMFLNAHEQFAAYLDVPLTALHDVLQEDYGRPFLHIGQWTTMRT